MRISQPTIYNTNFNSNYHLTHSAQDLINLRELLKTDVMGNYYAFTPFEEYVIKKEIPIFTKNKFDYEDYKTLSNYEKTIIRNLNNKGKSRAGLSRHNISINKDSERILDIATDIKRNLDNKYQNGYKLISIGNSAAPVTEAMKILGSDTVTLPFSKELVDYKKSEYPFQYIKMSPYSFETNFQYEKFAQQDWMEYLKYYSLDGKTVAKNNKPHIFTDWVTSGHTFNKVLQPILLNCGYNEKTINFIPFQELLNNELCNKHKIEGCDINSAFENSEFKRLASKMSAKEAKYYINVVKNPSFIESLAESLISKLFHCAVYEKVAQRNWIR